ncbi:MAG: hypothetical protein FJ125_12135 [Deltaproteobacteria bacterium]|nr:hypothetical protein [Deltaproteobacteria bacterium]
MLSARRDAQAQAEPDVSSPTAPASATSSPSAGRACRQDPVPDDTTLVKFRVRIGTDGLRQVFELLNQQWEAAGLIASNRRVADGCHIWANVARRSWVSLLRTGRRLVIEAVATLEAARAKDLLERYLPAPARPEPRGPEALLAEQETTPRLLEEVGDLKDLCLQDRVLTSGDRPGIILPCSAYVHRRSCSVLPGWSLAGWGWWAAAAGR